MILTLGGNEVLAAHMESKRLFVSVVTEMECLSYPFRVRKDEMVVREFMRRCTVLGIEERIKEEAIVIRRDHGIKLPDAVIAATALVLGVPLLTADKGFLRLRNELVVDLFEP
ncbi:MAG: type II toxin-antitoxin system VapC family toxin [Flavobacteriales bacterium]|nr:type II toxin-antitoxin system VapC family toxin [Flavobacteriales bacterium]